MSVKFMEGGCLLSETKNGILSSQDGAILHQHKIDALSHYTEVTRPRIENYKAYLSTICC